jgi:hypothetical protein
MNTLALLQNEQSVNWRNIAFLSLTLVPLSDLPNSRLWRQPPSGFWPQQGFKAGEEARGRFGDSYLGLKPSIYAGRDGATEIVPFPKPFMRPVLECGCCAALLDDLDDAED